MNVTDSVNLTVPENRQNWVFSVIVMAVILAILYFLSTYNYLLFHTMAEMFSIVVAFGIFSLVWNARKFIDNSFFTVLGIGYFFIAFLDSGHMLLYRGMNILSFDGQTNLATQLWISSRALQAVTLVAASLLISWKPKLGYVAVVYIIFDAAILYSIFFSDIFPKCYIDGVGVTLFKRISEYIISAVFMVSIFILWGKKRFFSNNVLRLLIGAASVMIISELSFSSYVDVYGTLNFIGHCLKIIAIYLIYKAIIEIGIRNPFDLFFKNMKETENDLKVLAKFPEENPSPVLRISKECILQYANKSSLLLKKAWGCNVGEMVPENICAIVNQCINSGYINEIEIDVNEAMYSLIFAPIADMDYVNVYGRDITKRKQIEESLIQSEERLKRQSDILMEQAHILDLSHVFVWNEKEGIVSWNKGAEILYGWSKEEALGKTPHKLLKTTFSKPLKDINDELYLKRCWQGELIQSKKSGEKIVVASYVVLHFNKERNTLSIIETDNNITKLKETEKALMETRDYLENLFKFASAPIVCWDSNFKITRFNRAFENLSGYKEAEILGRDFSLLFPENVKEEFIDNIMAISLGEQWESVEIPICRKDGEIRIVLCNSANIYASDTKKVLTTIVQGQDITERKQAEDVLKRDKETFEKLVNERTMELFNAQIQLVKSKRLSDIGELAATVAHELRNPLGVIRTAVYNIKRKSKDSTLNSHLSNIEKKILESDQIINNLLGYTRIKTPQYESIKLYYILDECINSIRDRYETKNIFFTKNLETIKELYIDIDPFQIREVINNVLDNACQAVYDKEGKIYISAVSDNIGSIGISFNDNGIGIKKEDLRKIFEPFFTKKSKGTGLGLTICSELINLLGGDINIESEYGKGTTVSIKLPIKARSYTMGITQ